MDRLALVEVLSELPDPRSPHGRFHPLPALLALVVLGLLMGRTSLAGIARLGRLFGAPLAQALGFRRGQTPAQSTLSEVLRLLDAQALEALLARWVRSRLPPGVTALSLDGKALRGSRDGAVPGQHLVSAYAPQAEAALGQVRVDAKTNEHKAALQLLGILPLKGKVVLGDAAFCQRDLAEAVVAAEGDYVFTVKANQKGLQTDVAAGFGFEAAARSIAAAFSPGAAACAARPGGDPRGEGPRPGREAGAADDVDPDAAREAAGAGAGLRDPAGADGAGGDDGGGGLRRHQPGAGAGRRGAAAGAGAGALADRELPALGAGRDAGGGRLPGAQGQRAAGAGGAAQRRGTPVAGGAGGEPSGGGGTAQRAAPGGPATDRAARL